MIRNVGGAERIVRVVIGVLLLGLFALEGPWSWLGLLAVIPLATAAIGYCPLWQALGVNTVHKEA